MVETTGTATVDGAVALLEVCDRARNLSVPAAGRARVLTLTAVTGNATDAEEVSALDWR